MSKLTQAEFIWVLQNFYADQNEDFDKYKLLLRFINPEGAKKLFDENKTEVTVSTEDFMFEQMSKDLKGKYSKEELAEIMEDPKHFSELDRIEKA